MLQPSQLRDIWGRYAAEIAEVRRFLLRAGVRVETTASLADTVRRLDEDPSFHRDLGSHALMLLYAGAGVPEVLQVLAVAAAGPKHASAADAHDAHDLLRFVMDTRNSLTAKGGERSATAHDPLPPVMTTPPAIPVASPVILPTDVPVDAVAEPTPELEAPHRVGVSDAGLGLPASIVQPDTLPSIAPFTELERVDFAGPAPAVIVVPVAASVARARRIRSVAVAACLLLALPAGVWMYRRSADDATTAGTAPVEEETSAAAIPSAAFADTPSIAVSPEHPLATRRSRTKEVRDNPSVIRESRAVVPDQSAYFVPRPASSSAAFPVSSAPVRPATSVPSSDGAASSAPVVRSSPTAGTRNAASSNSPGAAVGKAASPPVPNAVLAGRLGSPSANAADAGNDRVAGTNGYPQLLRRKASDTNGTVLADASPSPAMSGSNMRTAAFPSGMVRSTSLGIPAGNLMYAPDPLYPAAAASQHVSGQVTVQALVDREGKVASARVVSGPPLLRDAAVNAMQQWRYRPLLAGGKPQTFSATAVMDFQLR